MTNNQFKKITQVICILLCLMTILGSCMSSNSNTETQQETNENTQEEITTQEEATTNEEDLLINMDDVMNLTAEQVRNMETTSGKKAAISIDVVCQLYTGVTIAKIRSAMRSIKNMGVKRVYLIMCSPSYPMMSGGTITSTTNGLTSEKLEQSLKALGEDPNKVYIDMCHEYGLEAIATIKPYEGGGGVTIPEGTSITDTVSEHMSGVTPACIGGSFAYMDTFISEHPEMRVKRKSGTGETVTSAIDTMELVFYTASTLPNVSTMNSAAVDKPTLWVSKDNATYSVYNNFTYEYTTVNSYDVVDVNGESVFNRKAVILTLHINGTTLDDQYFVCTFQADSKIMTSGLYSRPYSMMKLYSNGKEVPSTLGLYVRKPSDTSKFEVGAYTTPVCATSASGISVSQNGTPIVSYKDTATGIEDFVKYGIEYEYVYTSHVTNGYMAPFFALAAGKNQYVKGLLCEGYEEVRAYWLEQVNTALSYGADGIDIRWDGHSSMVSDYYYYGYNEPIAQKYQELYHVSLESEPVCRKTAVRVMLIRGDYFLQFLESASTATHAKGKIFISHIFATSYDITTYYNKNTETYQIPSTASNAVAQWKMPKIIVDDYKRVVDISDEIVYKDYFSASYTAADQQYGIAVTQYILSQKKPYWIHCYVQQNPKNQNTTFFTNFLKSTATGFTFYELTSNYIFADSKNYITTYIDSSLSYEISLADRITNIPANTTARQLIEKMAMIGQNVVVDENGKSVPLDTVLTKDMKLRLNGKLYSISIS